MIESVSRRAFGRSTGVYNVRASEQARDRKLNLINATVVLLDDTQHVFQIEKKAKGQVLLDQVFKHLELIEKDYFGLQFTENGVLPNSTNTEITRWLDVNKSVKKQVGGSPLFWLAIRFYPPEPSRLAEEYTRYQLCLQLRRLLLDSRLTAPKNTALLLASFTVQAELGDFNAEDHPPNYLSEMSLLPKQSAEDERKIRELHKLHRGQLPADAEANFLEHAKRLDCYGVEQHPAKDSNGKDITIGVTSGGIVVFQNSIRVNTFSWAKIVKISFKRKQFFIQIKREPSESYDTVLGFNMRSNRAAKSLWRGSVEQHGFFRLQRPRRSRGPLLGALGALAGLGTTPHVARTESQALEDARRAHTLQRIFMRQGSSRTRERASMSPGKVSLARASVVAPSGRSGHSRVTTHEAHQPRPAWGADEPVAHSAPDRPTPPIHASDDEGGFLERVLRGPLPYVDDSSSGAEEEPDDTSGLVTVRLAAGADGRFGFNVRGGRGMPVLVSRVAPATPAHQAHPAIQEGDQVIAINGKEVESMCHEQVVQLIRNTRGILTLTLKPNAVYGCEEDRPSVPEEPVFCFVPLENVAGSDGDALAQSMLMLGDGLASGAALLQYDTLLRKLPDEPALCAKLQNNLALNRYRDIAPYDKTRVILKNGPNGDYINASYINMEIPSSDLVLTYIATQGPLAFTVGDFWQMVWESESTLVVMLTVLSERGRTKCHQYWSNVGSAPLNVTSNLTLHTLSEQQAPNGHYLHREMLLKENGPGGAVRTINQLQYAAWPDHGVPDDATAFIRFTQLCSSLRTRRPVLPTVIEDVTGKPPALDPPMIVHCSAGVGRTGALILAETALELLQRRQPLYPLDLVRHMRAQRPMCIQNVSQYKFVCESIQTAYSQGLYCSTSESSSN